MQKVAWLAGAGVAALALGFLWGTQFPIVKKIWTSSFVLVAGGWSLLLLALFYYVIDVRGYGASTRPKEMEEPAVGRAALVRSNEAVRDIGSAVDWIRKRRRVSNVALFGWATGGQWAGY